MAKSNVADLPGPEDLLGSRLREARKQAGMTVADLHEQTRISKSSIARYESGDRNPPAKELRQLCDALEVSPNYLLYGDAHPEFGSKLTSLREFNVRTNREIVAAVNLLVMTLSRPDREALLQLLFSLVSEKLGKDKMIRLNELISQLAKTTEDLEERHGDEMADFITQSIEGTADEEAIRNRDD